MSAISISMLLRICGKKRRPKRSVNEGDRIGIVKQTEPNALQQELARSQPVGVHPDADLLTAFAEGTLLARERTEVLAHLSACSACREVVSVAASAAETVAAGPSLVPRRSGLTARAWAPWIGIAAAVGIVSTAVLVRHRTSPSAVSHNQIALVEQNPTLPPAAVPPQAVPPAKERKALQIPTPSQAASIRGRALAPVGEAAPPPPPAMAPPQFAPAERGMEVPQITSAGQPVAVQSTNETVSVNSDAVQLETESTRAQNQVVAGAAAPALDKKSPAPAAGAAATFGSLMRAAPASRQVTVREAARALWRINTSGQPERTAADRSWQAVRLPGGAARMRVVAVIGNDVWIGGEAMQLFHSSDGGTTWAPVTLPTKGGLQRAITQIRFTSQQIGTIETDEGISWTTTDNGATWH
jgi:hypothetical protein